MLDEVLTCLGFVLLSCTKALRDELHLCYSSDVSSSARQITDVVKKPTDANLHIFLPNTDLDVRMCITFRADSEYDIKSGPIVTNNKKIIRYIGFLLPHICLLLNSIRELTRRVDFRDSESTAQGESIFD